MEPLQALLDRTGLSRQERLLVYALACVWPGEHQALADCIRHYRVEALPREDLEEVLLQAVLFCGFPRVINSFHILNEEWPAGAAPKGGALPADEQRAAGDALFSAIYGDNTTDVKAMLNGFHGELAEFVMDTAYGRILSRPGLSARMRELMAVGVLALTGQIPQLVAHGRGARKFGASSEAVSEAIYTTTGDAELAERLTRRIG